MLRDVKGLAPLHNRALVFGDLETFGFGKQQPVIEWAGVKRKPDGTTETLDVQVAVTDYEVAKAEAGALRVTGWTPEAWTTAMPKTTAFTLVHNFLAAHTLVGFNVDGDIARLEREFEYSEIPVVRRWCEPLELSTLCRARHKGWPAYNLEEACRQYGLEPEGAHRALGGATRAMLVWDKLMGELR